MCILVINVGSSSIKLGLFDFHKGKLKEIDKQSYDPDLSSIPQYVKVLFETHNIEIKNCKFALRIVHGGPQLSQPVEITSKIYDYLHSIQSLAPLHNPPAIQTIKHLKQTFPNIKIYGAFDTMFHTTMPYVSSTYALPSEFQKIYDVKRYGFHGFAHASMLRIYSEQLQVPQDKANIITMQLGSGCSMCAIQYGQSVNTTMGFSPLEGLISRTRTGDIDPYILFYLHEKTGKSYDELFEMFNKQAGLKGLSGTEGHIQELLDMPDEKKEQALSLFIFRIQQYLGAYEALLQGSQAIILGGGISEHSPEIWNKIFANPYFQVTLDNSPSFVLQKPLTRISSDNSTKHAYVAYVDEEYEIACAVARVL